MAHPARSFFRTLNALRWELRAVVLKLFCDFLLRWGSKLGISPNFRGKMLWKAGRRDIVPRPELYKFMAQARPDGQYYPSAPQWSSRSQTVIEVLSPLIAKEDSILEIGCNLGRNLNHLWRAGYKNVRGMEISEHAIRRLRFEYPCLAAVLIDLGPAELSIQKCPDSSADVIFTMAMLEHLHQDSRFVFNEIARVARKYVLAIESRVGKRSHMQYPWDIKSELTAAGLTWIDTKPWSVFWTGELTRENEWSEDKHEYDAFLFKANKADV